MIAHRSEMACLDVHGESISSTAVEMQEPSIETNKLSYEIFSILETKFLFECDDQKLWVPKEITELKNTGGFQDVKSRRGKICILSVDGGGMRGIISGKALSFLEKALKNKSGNPDARIADYFDVAAGTGVGGILVPMLFAANNRRRPIFHAEDTWKFVATEGKKLHLAGRTRGLKGGLLRRIFRGAGGPSTSGLGHAMKEVFKDEINGRSLTLKDTLKPVLIPCYDLSSAAPFLFSRADALESDSFDFNLWEVCSVTAAEPAVFGPVCMKSVDGLTRCVGVDGGVAMSNPTAAAITHVLHNKQEFPFVRGLEDIMVLSIGAGGPLLEGSFDLEQVNKWKASDWLMPLARISGEGSVEMVDHAVAMAFGESRSDNYVRIQANGSSLARSRSNVDSESNVQMLMQLGDEMLKQKSVESVLFSGKRIVEQTNSAKLDLLAEQLVLEHQRRSCRIAPTVAFKQPMQRKPS